MRRVLAIGLAVLLASFASQGAMAQDSQQDVSERLLEILRDRQIISEEEYGELKSMAEQMKGERSELDARLNDLDRSIADYLAQGGDRVYNPATGASTTYTRGLGFGWRTGDGLFALNIGGLFQFQYTGLDNDNVYGLDFDPEFEEFSRRRIPRASRDRNSFDVNENRFHFRGHAMDPNLRYYIEFDADDSVWLLDAYVDYNLCDWANLRAGQFKVPQGRQALVHESDRQLFGMNGISSIFYIPRDVGIMFHDILPVQTGSDATFSYMLGIWNGEGPGASANTNNWLAWGGRLQVDPWGYIGDMNDVHHPWKEGAWNAGKMVSNNKFKASLGGHLFRHKTASSFSTTTTQWGFDATVTWWGLYLTGEWFDREFDPDGFSDIDTDGWYVQGGWYFDQWKLEIGGLWGTADLDDTLFNGGFADDTDEWRIFVNYYFDEEHYWKIGAQVGQTDTDIDGSGDFDTTFVSIIFQLEW